MSRLPGAPAGRSGSEGPPRFRELAVAGPILALALAALAFSWVSGRQARTSRTAWIEEARQDYGQLWEGLREEAARAASALGPPPGGDWDKLRTQEARLAAFRQLDRVEVREEHGRRALLLLDPDGAPVAWAGEGLLHELPDEVPRSGLHYRAGFSAVTLLAVRPLDGTRRPWRVVSGASFSTDVLPFEGGRIPARWSLVDAVAERDSATPGTTAIRRAGAPTLIVEPFAAPVEPTERPLVERLAWAAIGLTLIWLAVVRGLRIVLPGGPPSVGRSGGAVTPLALGGLLALGPALSVPPVALTVLILGLGLTALGLRWRSTAGDRVPVPLKGLLAVALLFLAVWGFLQFWDPLSDIDAGILVAPERFAVRLGFCGLAFGLFCLAGRLRCSPAPPSRDRWSWAAVVLLVAGAAFCDQPAAALPLLGLGGAATAVYAFQRRQGDGLALLPLTLMAVLAASGVWETAYRLRLREFAANELLDRLSPPKPREVAALSAEVRDHFRALDLAALVPRSPAGLERQDLAYALWRDSPLAKLSSLSALVVQPLDGSASSFSFGIPLTETDEGDFRLLPSPWQNLSLPLWEDTRVSGRAEIRFAGRLWGRVRYWLVPRPGFEAQSRERLREVEAGLLKGAPAEAPLENVSDQVLFALYSADRRAVLSPWEEEPPLPAGLRGSGKAKRTAATVYTPSGRARAWARGAPGGWEVVYLPILPPIQALERAGRFAVGTLLLLTLVAPPVLLLALPRASFRDLLWRTVRSYSKRLMIVYTILLLVPLLLLNLVLVRVMEERLRREQRSAGESALASAQEVLGERLFELPLGFGVDTSYGDQLLVDLASIVRHEVNLYWGSGIYASSRHELFTAGLLPKRMPGEAYSRLTLLGYGFASRTNRVGGTTYLEMYAPLRVPGIESGQERRLVLSVPLLAQQEEAARELSQLRGHGLLVTATLFILLVAVGRRLARSFTRPLMQLIEGTRRIAAGAPSLDLAPTELELAALVEAVDQMARRIAEGREKLLREKDVVERMVDNITSGVVSLDGERRVLLHNRVAAELLGTEVGHSLEEAVERSERLAPVAAFLGTAGAEMARQTVRLKGEDGTEREWALVWVPLPGAGEPAALLVVEDATEVLRGQRLLAWAEMARMIAHEIKNPLTPIRLSAEHMREVYRHDPDHFDRVFERCTTNILTQVEELRSIASDFSIYSSIPRIDPKPADLAASMSDLVEGYRAAPPEGVSIELEIGEEAIPLRFDAKLLHRAVRNLIENALRASAGGGRVVVRVDQVDSTARVAVLDSGPGVDPDTLLRIFDPYFSTHDTGTGLGLPIARRIVEEHGGEITARNRPGGGLEVVVTLPL